LKYNKTGLVFGVSAYVLWGLFPLYWPLLEPAGAFEIVGHRAVWSLVFCVIALALTKAIKPAVATMRRPKVFLKLLTATALISVNWVVYIWATNNGHVVEASLGYYITPLVNVAFGVFMLREKMRPLQWAAVSVAAIGVAALTFDFGHLPWIAIGLAVSWGLYSVIKKSLPVTALQGLTVETCFLGCIQVLNIRLQYVYLFFKLINIVLLTNKCFINEYKFIKFMHKKSS
jgi:chloramphenicol-sensitive protein RarD